MPTSSDSPAPGGIPQRPGPILRLEDVAAGYGGAPIVSGVSLDVGPGEVVAVIGPERRGQVHAAQGGDRPGSR